MRPEQTLIRSVVVQSFRNKAVTHMLARQAFRRLIVTHLQQAAGGPWVTPGLVRVARFPTGDGKRAEYLRFRCGDLRNSHRYQT